MLEKDSLMVVIVLSPLPILKCSRIRSLTKSTTDKRLPEQGEVGAVDDRHSE